MNPQPRGRLLPLHHGDEELYGDDLAVDVDDEHAGGGWSPPEVDSGGISPLRSSPMAAFCLSVSGFVFLRRPLAKLLGGLFMQSFWVTRMLQGEGSMQTGPRGLNEVGPRSYSTRPHGTPILALWPPLVDFFRS